MAYLSRLIKKKLGEILVDAGLVREAQISEALKKQKESGRLLGEVLVGLGYVKEEDIAYAIAKQFGLPYLDASKFVIQGDYSNILPAEQMLRRQFIILDKIGKLLIVATATVIDTEFIEELERKSKSQVFFYVATSSQVLAALQKHYKVGEGAKAGAN